MNPDEKMRTIHLFFSIRNSAIRNYVQMLEKIRNLNVISSNAKKLIHYFVRNINVEIVH